MSANDSALFEASEWNLELVKTLLKQGANVNVRNKRGLSALHVASMGIYTGRGQRRLDDPSIVDVLLAHGAKMDVRTIDTYETPLITSVRHNHYRITEHLLNAGADPNATDDEGRTPLHFSVMDENPRIAKLLLDKGADINAKTKDGDTPVNSAGTLRPFFKPNDMSTLELLLDRGADLTIRDKEGRTPLDKAKQFKLKAAISLIEKKLALIEKKLAARSLIEIGHKTQFPPEINAMMMEYLVPTTKTRTPEQQEKRVEQWRAMVRAGPAIEAAQQRRREAEEQAQKREMPAATTVGGKPTRRRRVRGRKTRRRESFRI